MRILAIDPSITKTGWAVLESDRTELIDQGYYRPRDKWGRTRFQNLGVAVRGWCGDYNPDAAIFEKASLPYHGKRINRLHFNNYVSAVSTVENELCEVLGCDDVYGVYPQTWKQTKGKKTTIREANLLFRLELKKKDNDIADAIMLGVFFIERQRIPETALPPILECTF